MTGVPLPVLLLLPSLFVLFHELHAHFPLSPSHQVFTFDFSSLRKMIVLFFQMIHDFLRMAHLTSLQLVRRSAFRRWQSSSSYDSRDNDLIPPTTCCMSNCANCKTPLDLARKDNLNSCFRAGVWFTFAEEIAQRYPDAPMHVIDDVLKKYIDDPSFREFLEFEIKLRSIGNKSQS